jgi:GNAT superfamily N-acetyltransferase
MNVLQICDLKTLEPSHKKDILRLAKRNSPQLINRPVKSNHPMFGLTTAWMLADIELQLDPYTSSRTGSELILVTDHESKTTGFLTYNRAYDSTTACGLNYVCVDAKHRKQGLMTLMIDYLKSNFTEIALACFPDLVEMYEKQGFVMCEAAGSQIAMRIGSEYIMKKVSPQMLMDHSDFKHAAQLFITKYGEKKATKINNFFDEETVLLSKRVEAFVRYRKTNSK